MMSFTNQCYRSYNDQPPISSILFPELQHEEPITLLNYYFEITPTNKLLHKMS